MLHAALVRKKYEIANRLTKQQEKKQQFSLGEQLDSGAMLSHIGSITICCVYEYFKLNSTEYCAGKTWTKPVTNNDFGNDFLVNMERLELILLLQIKPPNFP